jgi:tetratricopeptide (TPR) repeat protein
LYQDAIRAWKEALKLSPEDTNLLFLLAKAHQHLAQFDSSNQSLYQVIANESDNLKSHIMMIMNYLFMGNHEASKQIYRKLEAMFPELYQLLILRGDIAAFMSQYEIGETFYLRAIQIDSHNSEAYFKMAAILVVQEKEKFAENYFKKAISFDDQSKVQYWLHRSAYQALKRNSDRAVFAMQKALEIQPNSYYLQIKIAQLLLTYKRYKALIDLMETDQTTLTESTTIQKYYVEALLNTHELDKAHSILQNHERSKDLDWLLFIGKKYLLQGSFSVASSYFERVAASRKNDPNATYMLAVAYLAADKVSLATRTLIRLLTAYPDMVEAELALATIYFKKEEYDLSIDYLNRVINKSPENPRPYILLGNCMLSIGRYAEAESHFKKALFWDSNCLSAQYYLALAKEKTGQRDEAIQLYRSILLKSPTKADVGQRLANLLINEGRAEEAIDLFKPLVSSHPENGYHKLILGNIYRSSHQYDKAAYYYRLAVEASPNLVAGYRNLADLQPDNSRKIEIIKDALRKVPDSIDLLMFLASIYFSDDQLDLAISVMNEAYRIDPDNPSAANNLSWIFLETETKLNDAYELAMTAFEKDEGNPSYAHTLGWALYKKGLFRKAEWQFRESLRLMEKNKRYAASEELGAIVSYHLALTLFKTGQKVEAKEKLVYAIETGLPSRYEKRAREFLKTIQGSGDRALEPAGAEAGPTF